MAVLHDFNLCGMDRHMDGQTLLKRCKDSSNNSFKSSTNIQALIFQLCLVRCFKVLFKSSFIANRFGVGYKIPEIVCLVMQKHFIHPRALVDINQLIHFQRNNGMAFRCLLASLQVGFQLLSIGLFVCLSLSVISVEIEIEIYIYMTV